MRIYYISDLHLERFNFVPKIKNYKHEDKILVLAGDIATTYMDQKIADGFFNQCYEMFGKDNVYYIKGNHEYYKSEYDETKVIRLKDTTRKIVGCTLWTDFENGSIENMLVCSRGIDDFHLIEKHTPLHQYKYFKRDFKFLKKNVKKDSIVITHHLPSFKCINKLYKDSDINGAFASNLNEFIIDKKPKVWIHGHTHKAVDTKIGDTRIICNPFGYLGRERFMSPTDFLPLKWIDL